MKKEKRDNLSNIKNKTYKKSNELINAKGRGTLLSQKLFAIGLQHLSVDKTNNVIATIDSSELKALFKSDSGSLYTHIEKATDRTQAAGGQTIFDWQILEKDPENDSLVARQVVTDAEFKNGTLTIRYNNSLTNQIIDLQNNFTTLKLSETMGMKSVHSLRLLEILKSAYDKECAQTKDYGKKSYYFHLVDLKMRLGIVMTSGDRIVRQELAKEFPDYDMIEERLDKNGDNKYKEYKDFNKSVIKKAVAEINAKTGMQISYEATRKGRNTAGIWFFVERADLSQEKDKEKKLTQKEKDDILDNIYEILHSDFKMSEVRDICTFAEYDRDKVIDAYEYMRHYQSSIDTPVAFIKAAIRDGYKYEPTKTVKSVNKNNKFFHYEQRNYDNNLEKILLDN